MVNVHLREATCSLNPKLGVRKWAPATTLVRAHRQVHRIENAGMCAPCEIDKSSPLLYFHGTW